MKIPMFSVEDRGDVQHKIRIDRISAYYCFKDINCWKMSIVLFGCDKQYEIEFHDFKTAGVAFDRLNKHFE